LLVISSFIIFFSGSAIRRRIDNLWSTHFDVIPGPVPQTRFGVGQGKYNDDDNSIQFFIYLRAELNSQWPVTEPTRIQTTAKDNTGQNKINNKRKKEKNGSAKAFYAQIGLSKISVD
jgi:hypothetical protein